MTAPTETRGRPFAKGHDPRRGVGLKGRSGRKPNRFKALLNHLQQSPPDLRAAQEWLDNFIASRRPEPPGAELRG